jgi:hypothetical protein
LQLEERGLKINNLVMPCKYPEKLINGPLFCYICDSNSQLYKSLHTKVYTINNAEKKYWTFNSKFEINNFDTIIKAYKGCETPFTFKTEINTDELSHNSYFSFESNVFSNRLIDPIYLNIDYFNNSNEKIYYDYGMMKSNTDINIWEYEKGIRNSILINRKVKYAVFYIWCGSLNTNDTVVFKNIKIKFNQ